MHVFPCTWKVTDIHMFIKKRHFYTISLISWKIVLFTQLDYNKYQYSISGQSQHIKLCRNYHRNKKKNRAKFPKLLICKICNILALDINNTFSQEQEFRTYKIIQDHITKSGKKDRCAALWTEFCLTDSLVQTCIYRHIQDSE